MGASRTTGAAVVAAPLVAAALLVTLAGCSQAPPQQPPAPLAQPVAAAGPSVVAIPPPQTVTPAAPSAPGVGTEEPVPAKVKGTEPIVIDEGGKAAGRGRSLAEAAASERERRRGLGTPLATIDDQNLAQHATGALTTSAPSQTPLGEVPDLAADEQHWRQRVRSVREEWAAEVDSILELQERTAELRTRFYATDDPYVRDGQVKPAWDHALQSLEDARRRARQLENELEATLEEGRQAGALPGWLREGMELEPTERPYDPPPRRHRNEPVEGRELVGEPVESDG